MAGRTTPHARGRAPGCVATGPLWGQGRLRPGSFVDTGLHHSKVAAIPVWARDAIRAPARTPPNRKCAPAAAPRREEGQCSTTGGDWRESTGLVAPGTRSGLAGVVATRLRGVKTHQPFFKRRTNQRRLRPRSERNKTRTEIRPESRTGKKKAPRTPKEERRLPLQEPSRIRRRSAREATCSGQRPVAPPRRQPKAVCVASSPRRRSFVRIRARAMASGCGPSPSAHWSHPRPPPTLAAIPETI